jgi:mono/diheme cytochrome c family protein
MATHHTDLNVPSSIARMSSMRWSALLALLGACATPEPVDHQARRNAHRDTLKARLGSDWDTPVDVSDADISRGAEVWAKSCAACHGPAGRGDGPRAALLQPPPPDLISGPSRSFYSDRGQVMVIAEGAPGTAMPPFGRSLLEADLRAVYAHIVALRASSP